ncbi:hypothetical protein Arub01_36330 [Actinomadura rubrobrunea]|uniref:Uncharacterized protein n=1 Tax=Actinomadura rubrobrunea TaxID=115335 RepID=A0A9W6UVS2_9ACTN|nr:hypothetical protein Arub01_36330 [Actinomadura rubrobrunea]
MGMWARLGGVSGVPGYTYRPVRQEPVAFYLRDHQRELGVSHAGRAVMGDTYLSDMGASV